MSQRTFKPDAEKIDKLRVQKGWALPDLARKACVSNRTIDSIMLGNEVVISTLAKVANAFDAPVDSLIVGYVAEPPVKTKRFTVAFRMAVEYEEFDEAKDLIQFLAALQKLLDPMNDRMDVLDVVHGSVTIEINMSVPDIMKLLQRWIDGDIQMIGYDIKDHPLDQYGLPVSPLVLV